ncbi:MAG: DegV family protein [Coriobacteriia bacterium]
MQQVGIVTESTSDIAPDIARAMGIEVVPLTVTIGDETFADGTLTQREFFDRMNAAAILPTTSLPPVGVFVETYKRQLERFSEVVSIHVSSALSGTIESAREAAKQFGDRVKVFDTRNLSWGEALQVVEAARAASAGATSSAVVERLGTVRSHVKMIVALDTLENLAKGGRIGKVAALFGGMLNLKVTITPNESGAFDPVARSRGTKAALEHTMNWVAETMGTHRRAKFAIMHALSPDKVPWIEERLRAAYDVEDLYVVEAGSAICTHTGTGWGVALLPTD